MTTDHEAVLREIVSDAGWADKVVLTQTRLTALSEVADILAKLPRDAEGEIAVADDMLYSDDDRRWRVVTYAVELIGDGDISSGSSTADVGCLHSTREAAEQAAKGGG